MFDQHRVSLEEHLINFLMADFTDRNDIPIMLRFVSVPVVVLLGWLRTVMAQLSIGGEVADERQENNLPADS